MFTWILTPLCSLKQNRNVQGRFYQHTCNQVRFLCACTNRWDFCLVYNLVRVLYAHANRWNFWWACCKYDFLVHMKSYITQLTSWSTQNDVLISLAQQAGVFCTVLSGSFAYSALLLFCSPLKETANTKEQVRSLCVCVCVRARMRAYLFVCVIIRPLPVWMVLVINHNGCN